MIRILELPMVKFIFIRCEINTDTEEFPREKSHPAARTTVIPSKKVLTKSYGEIHIYIYETTELQVEFILHVAFVSSFAIVFQ